MREELDPCREVRRAAGGGHAGDGSRWSLPVSHCCGPCNQGGLPCPIPEACHATVGNSEFAAWELFWFRHYVRVAIGAAISFALIVWATKP